MAGLPPIGGFIPQPPSVYSSVWVKKQNPPYATLPANVTLPQPLNQDTFSSADIKKAVLENMSLTSASTADAPLIGFGNKLKPIEKSWLMEQLTKPTVLNGITACIKKHLQA